MPQRRKNRSSRRRAGGRGERADLPIGRVPRPLGAMQRLSPNNTVYPRMLRLDFPLVPITTSTVVGAISFVTNLVPAPATIANWANIAAVFDEVALVGVRLECRIDVTANPAGIVWAYIDEKLAAAPTLGNSQNKPRLDMYVSTNESPNRYSLTWKSRDFLDLQWIAASAPAIVAYFKMFASNAGTGTNAAGTFNVAVTGSIALCLRGYN
jgi:hypothetical protein